MDEARTGPLSRGERQRQTREALVDAARKVFVRAGYHGAGIDEIAHVAGYSKGAVYSNFAGKAELFLAVIDDNVQLLDSEDVKPFEPATADTDSDTDSEAAEVIRGIALATLEFVAVAARDPKLSTALPSRRDAFLASYTRMAHEEGPADDELTAEEVGSLVAALDQGATVLALSGLAEMDQRTLRIGLRRLVDPGRAATESVADEPGGPAGLYDQIAKRLIIAAQNNSD